MFATAAVAGPVEYDGPTYVNKGAIQSTLGMNDPEFQAAAAADAINFNWDVTVEFSWTCTRPRGNSGKADIVRQRSTLYHTRTVGKSIDADDRTNPNGKVLGYYLTPGQVIENRQGPREYTCAGLGGNASQWTVSLETRDASGGLLLNGILIHRYAAQ
jgi:hypothetical protein